MAPLGVKFSGKRVSGRMATRTGAECSSDQNITDRPFCYLSTNLPTLDFLYANLAADRWANVDYLEKHLITMWIKSLPESNIHAEKRHHTRDVYWYGLNE